MAESDNLSLYAKILLLQTMRDYSEDNYCASWLVNLEYDLWSLVLDWKTGIDDDVVKWGMGEVDASWLSELASDAGGWYHYSHEPNHGEQFISMKDWLIMYNGYLTNKKGV